MRYQVLSTVRINHVRYPAGAVVDLAPERAARLRPGLVLALPDAPLNTHDENAAAADSGTEPEALAGQPGQGAPAPRKPKPKP